MTEPVPPDDRDLEQYLQGDSPLSRRYRAASGETSPPELDEAVLAAARAELRRKRGPNRWLASVALAASVLLGVNLAWNLREGEPVPTAPAPQPAAAPPSAAAAEAPAAQRENDLAKRKADAPRELEARRSAEVAQIEQRQRAAAVQEREEKMAMAQESAEGSLRREAPADAVTGSAAARPSAAIAPPLDEARKIDRLIAYVGGLQGALFIRNGDEHQAAEAAQHLQMKREKAGKRVQTAGDFIRLCASHSYLTKEAYLIRFADGRTRTAEDVLREELARMEGRQAP